MHSGVLALSAWSALIVASCVTCIAAEETGSAVGGLPRYELKPGQELHYAGDGSFKYEGGEMESGSDWKIWVTRKNDDDSWRLVVRFASVHGSKDPAAEDAEVALAYLDLFPDGHFEHNPSFGYRFQPHVILAQLPANEAEVKSGWKAYDEAADTTYTYTAKTPDLAPSVDWQMARVDESPFNKIYLSTSESEMTFDRAKGMIREVTTKSTQKWGFNGEGTSSFALKEVVEREADWIATLDREMDRYLEVNKQYESLVENLDQAEDAEKKLDEAKELWTKLRAEVTNDVVQQAVDKQISQQDALRGYYIDSAKEKAAVLGKPAADWETTDLDGNPHRLADYAGKVVVLDFWYRGCGWCIRAMPQINQVAEEFASEPVAVLGMNNDSVLEDAKFVNEAMQLKYPSMHIDKELPGKYGVRGFPTVLILDQAGTVRDMHVGYSADLREKLSASIRKLLENPAPAPPAAEAKVEESKELEAEKLEEPAAEAAAEPAASQ